ncbi:MAG: ribosome biogenesis GTPase Der [Chitinophagales bacterium]|nr:ribosome biogenesis GTPase Der [Chitinophagales bacterium]HAE34917.1 ribosome biogenesis GTPase Der [Bacteroidota bacterium]MCB9020338.1 ribosome biogenesis GTPase Der [Chitinophagales bacterium]HPE98745.1 ribosome biogenesis GTPase Der [Chitinophagales bacterium]HPR29468.1 ribosome biogenesis GTPase Der [Chitinophagales bacterium]
MSFTVAIVGRPNVGKSTLFNRLTGNRQAIVDDLSGVTRDRHYGVVDWNGRSFNIIDTGGFVAHSDDVFEKAIRSQVEIAINEASILLLMVDVTTGLTDLDDDIIDRLRRIQKRVIIVVNKVDNSQRQLQATEFYSIGFEHTHFVSSITGSGTGELLDEVVAMMPADDSSDAEEEEVPRIAIVGQPNVGKSTLLNALIGEERNIVTDIAGTTRDAIHTRYQLFGKDFILIDTAGIRKKKSVREDVEFYTVIRAIKAIDEADVCILMIDAQTGVEGQDLTILQTIVKKKKGLVILVNKWDAVEKDHHTMKYYTEGIKNRIAPFRDVPIVFISALEKTRIFQAVEAALQVMENKKTKVATSVLNETLLPIIEATPPPTVRGNYVKIKYITQLPSTTPSFAFFTNYPKDIKDSYRQFLENKLRETFPFSGVPINIFFRQK